MRIGQVGFVKFSQDDYHHGLYIEATPEELVQLQVDLGLLREGDPIRVVRSQHCKCGVAMDPEYPEMCKSCEQTKEACGRIGCTCCGKHGGN